MKKIILLLALGICCLSLRAQTSDVESTIKALEQKEIQAVLQKDTATLKKIWSPDFTVNSPMNTIQEGGKNTLDRPVINQMSYLKFDRQTEKILVKGDMVITMGSELVVKKGQNGTANQTIRRRYTNIWMKQNNEWQLCARHANEICK